MELNDLSNQLSHTSTNVGRGLAVAGSLWTIVYRLFKSVGPFAVAHVQSLSEAQMRHKSGLAIIEVAKEHLKQELDNCSEANKELLHEYIKASLKKKLQIEQNLEFNDRRARQLKITSLAIGYAETNRKEEDQSGKSDDAEVSPHWIDKFNELSRVRNEEWRADLLARALAAEASSPGSVSTRALWVLGTLQESKFRAFSKILNLCSCVGSLDGYCIPLCNEFLDRQIQWNGPQSLVTIGRLIHMLSEEGLLGDISITIMRRTKGVTPIGRGSDCYIISHDQRHLEVRGLLLTELGGCIAQFCVLSPEPLGNEILQHWLKSLDKLHYQTYKANRSGNNCIPVGDPLY